MVEEEESGEEESGRRTEEARGSARHSGADNRPSLTLFGGKKDRGGPSHFQRKIFAGERCESDERLTRFAGSSCPMC